MITKPTSAWLAALLIMLLSLAAASCKNDSANQPIPQANSVVIGGKELATVSIGNQFWTAINYNGPGGITYRPGVDKPEYGRYYTFDEARAVILPGGWRLPTMQDYTILAENQGIVFTDFRANGQEASRKLASETNWRTVPGTNASGFNAQPAGYIFGQGVPLDGDICEFWMADGNTFSIQESANGKTHNVLFYSTNSSSYRFPLRFVKDKP